MAKILLTAAPYSFGPTSKLMCLAQELSSKHELIYVGGTPGLQLALTGHFNEVLDFGNRDAWDEKPTRALRAADLVISAHETRVLLQAQSVPHRTLFLDMLLWARPMPLPDHVRPAAYVAQRFFKPLDRAAWPTNGVRQVGAILPRASDTGLNLTFTPSVRTEPDLVCSRVLVNLGGLRSPRMLGDADLRYAEAVTRMLSACPVFADSSMDICVPPHMSGHRSWLQRLNPSARFLIADHKEFQTLLSRATLLLTVPGLESVLEAIACGIPLAFLPAHNGTQTLQSRVYRQHGLGLIHLESLLESPSSLSLVELSQEVQTRNLRLLRTTTVVSRLSTALDGALSRIDVARARENTRIGSQMLASIGKNGSADVSKLIEELAI